eukprot:2486264-Lingulodinium_polyedra.AAC.1
MDITLDSTTGAYEEFANAPGSPSRPLLESITGYIGVCNLQSRLLEFTTCYIGACRGALSHALQQALVVL